jgi:vacuolar-type H+-ATPase subunit I/STV1
MSDFVTGFVIGIPLGTAVGIALEIAIGIQQKSWSELTEEEKKIRKNALLAGVITLILGVIVFFLSSVT